MEGHLYKKIIFLIFLLSILIYSYAELSKNLKQIRIENTGNIVIENEVNKPRLLDQNHDLINKDTNIVLDIKLSDLGDWIAVERKDSYNNELQYYSLDNVVIDGDFINIQSRKETKLDKIYTSGMVESTNFYKYGFYEFIIQISEGKGLFPAIWLLPQGGGALPEIDLFEMVGNNPYSFYGVIHFDKGGIQDTAYFKHEVPIKDEYAISLDWRANSLTWYIDNEEIYTTTQGVPQEFMYIIINQAIGGNWPGNPDEDTIFPNNFNVNSIRLEPIYKKSR